MTRLRAVFSGVVITLSGCGATIGDSCTSDRDCGTTGTCLNRDFTPGGTCTLPCALGGKACPAGSTCVDDAIARDTPGCLRSCRSATDCRLGYVCQAQRDAATLVCVGPQGI